ncbi:T9SS-dependent choice-of-anchor J family protein [Epilithonimonas tenax]|uniref:T9SS-dependent choice-of-anchor J family protein n=1 Tax=Epilithonimonas tenax TaxID=191577 RepID=UPI0003F4D359|nr:choice-of-anchor J domain-containing protein [Epilithonimonas tenax]
MIKKLLSIGVLAFALNNYSAQVEVWKADFNDEDISTWTLYDDDEDGLMWGDIFQINNTAGNPVTPVSLISRSWQSDPLTPDNWAVSPAIDISKAQGNLTLSWITQVAAAAWDLEKYSVFVSTSPDQAALLASPVKLTETLGQGTNAGTPVNHTLDLTSFIGQPQIYIAFRHFDCTDQDFISIDDVTVKATSLLAISDVAKKSVSIYPNPTTEILNVNVNSKINSADIYDFSGKLVRNVTVSADNKVNVKDLKNGTYVLRVNTEAGSTSHKFIKK